MFKNVFRSLSKTFTGRDEPKPAAEAPAPQKVKPVSEKAASLLDKIGGAITPSDKKKGFAAKTPVISPEELCGVTSKMNKDQIRKQLALLYRRHNRATSSLDAKLRAEAEKMLTAVVAVREKHFGPI